MSDKAPAKSNQPESQIQDGTLAELVTLAQEYDQDRKVLRWAFTIAAIFHVIIFMIRFPSFVNAAKDAQKQQRKIFVVLQPKF